MLTSRQYSMPFALGEDAFGEYVIRDLLGQGPLGVVYLATNDHGDQFALKVLHKRWRTEIDLDQLNETYQRLDEFEDGTRLNLPTRVLVQDEYLGLSASYLEGLTVRKLMNLRKNTSKAFRLDELNQLVHGIATPLKSFHRDGIIHGGLKPENFFVTSDDEQKQVVTLSDACVSTGLGVEAYYKAQRAAGVGHYCAPELSENKMSLASDVYSLGVFIFEGITGQAYQTKKSITEIVPAQGIGPLEDLMTRALHPEPDQRYRDVNALLSAYEDVAKHLDSLEGSPFNSEGTQPRNESVVTKFSLTNMAKLDERADPLFSESSQGEDNKLPPPLPVENTEKTPPPLPSLSQQSKRNLMGGNAPLFPLNETPPPNIDLLSQVGEQRDSIPSLDAISDNQNLKFDSMKTPLSITVGAPQSRPIPIQPKNSNRQIWFGAVATVFAALALYMFLDQTSVPNTPIEVAIKLPLEAGQAKLNQKDGTSKKVGQVAVSSKQGKVGDESTAEQTEVQAAVKKAEAEAAAKKAQAEAEAAAIKKAEAEAAAIKKAEAEAAAIKKAEAKAAAIKKVEAKAAATKKAEAAAAKKAKTTAKKVDTDTKKAKAKADAKKAKADAKSARLAARQEAQAKAKAKKAEELAARQEAKAKRAAELAARKEAKAKAKAEKKAQLAAQKAAKAKKKNNQSNSSLKTKTKAESKSVVVPEKVQKQDDAKVLSCPGGMILKRTARFPRGSVRRGKIKGKRAIQLARNGKAYCIDAYEYPGRGQKPKVNITFNGAKSLCEQAGKRLCSGNEWVRACKGRGNASYPYGKRFNANKCITVDKEDEERRRSASGSMRSCKSASGAYDMSGNVAEWTSDQRVRGGYYASYDDEATCKSGGRRAPSSKRGYIGFRCCMDFKK